MPNTLQRWVRPRSESVAVIGVSRAIRQTIFDAPTSSTERTALFLAGIWRRRGVKGLKLMSPLSSPASWRPPAPPPPPPSGARTFCRARADRATAQRVRGRDLDAAAAPESPSSPADRPQAV